MLCALLQVPRGELKWTAAAELQGSPFQHKMTLLQAFGLRSNRKGVGLPTGYVPEVSCGQPYMELQQQACGVASPCLPAAVPHCILCIHLPGLVCSQEGCDPNLVTQTCS